MGLSMDIKSIIAKQSRKKEITSFKSVQKISFRLIKQVDSPLMKTSEVSQVGKPLIQARIVPWIKVFVAAGQQPPYSIKFSPPPQDLRRQVGIESQLTASMVDECFHLLECFQTSLQV